MQYALAHPTAVGRRRVPEHRNLYGRTLAHWKYLVRADLSSPRRIVDVMAEDLRELLAPAGHVTHDDLVLRGWKASQIAEHATAALERARRRAGSDA